MEKIPVKEVDSKKPDGVTSQLKKLARPLL